MATKQKAPTGPTLLDLAAEWDETFRVIEELEGEITPEMEARIAALEFSEASKVDGYRFRRLQQDNEAAHLRAQAKALTARAAKKEEAGDRLDASMKLYMDYKGIRELAGHSYRAKLVPNTPSVAWVAPIEALPADLVRKPPAPPPEPDKVAIKQRIKEQGEAREAAGDENGWLERELRAEDGTVLARLSDPTFHVRWS